MPDRLSSVVACPAMMRRVLETDASPRSIAGSCAAACRPTRAAILERRAQSHRSVSCPPTRGSRCPAPRAPARAPRNRRTCRRRKRGMPQGYAGEAAEPHAVAPQDVVRACGGSIRRMRRDRACARRRTELCGDSVEPLVHPAVVARQQLAILDRDHNAGAGRPPAWRVLERPRSRSTQRAGRAARRRHTRRSGWAGSRPEPLEIGNARRFERQRDGTARPARSGSRPCRAPRASGRSRRRRSGRPCRRPARRSASSIDSNVGTPSWMITDVDLRTFLHHGHLVALLAVQAAHIVGVCAPS